MMRRFLAAHTRIVVPTLDVFLKHYTDSKYVKADFENLVKNETLIVIVPHFHENLYRFLRFITSCLSARRIWL